MDETSELKLINAFLLYDILLALLVLLLVFASVLPLYPVHSTYIHTYPLHCINYMSTLRIIYTRYQDTYLVFQIICGIQKENANNFVYLWTRHAV